MTTIYTYVGSTVIRMYITGITVDPFEGETIAQFVLEIKKIGGKL